MIKAFDSVRGYQEHEAEFNAAFGRVMRSGHLILGPELRAFESEFAGAVGAEWGVGVASGTDALELALLAVGVGHGDEVITVANSAIPTAAAIRSAGAIPRFVDVDPVTLLMTPETVLAAITTRTRCLLPVHLHGYPAAMPELCGIARQHHLRVIEDCAHAHGALLQSRHVGTFGDVGCFSFYPTKNIGAFGDAGICVTSQGDLAERLRALRMYGCDESRIAQGYGRNSRLDELQAALLRVSLSHFPKALERRLEIVDRYRAGLAGAGCQLPTRVPNGRHAHHQFVIRCAARAAVVSACEREGVGFGIHYPVPLHKMPAFRSEANPPVLSVTEAAARQMLSLPLYPELRDDEVDRVVEVIRKGLSGGPQDA